MLSTGYNCRDLLNVALFRPVFSPSEYIQIKGRGTRLFDFEHDGQMFKKDTFHLLDYCGVTSYFEEKYDYSEPLRVTVDSGGSIDSPSSDGDPNVIDDPSSPINVIPVWEGIDIVLSEEDHIVGPEGEKVDVMTYRGRFEKELSEFVKATPDFKAAIDDEDDDRIEEILNERFLNKAENYFSTEKLIKAYDIPTTIIDFIYSALGKKELPTKEILSKDTTSSLSSMYELSYEERRWIEATTNLIINDPQAMNSFINNEMIDVFSRPQFNQLGGIGALQNFEKRDLVFNSLKDTVLVRQARKGLAA